MTNSKKIKDAIVRVTEKFKTMPLSNLTKKFEEAKDSEQYEAVWGLFSDDYRDIQVSASVTVKWSNSADLDYSFAEVKVKAELKENFSAQDKNTSHEIYLEAA